MAGQGLASGNCWKAAPRAVTQNACNFVMAKEEDDRQHGY